MPITMTFFDDVNDWLSVGGDLDLAAEMTGDDFEVTISQLMEHGVTHVLDLREEWDDQELWLEMGLPVENYCHAPIVDDREHTPPEWWFTKIEDFVRWFWANSYEGDRLYVHCMIGVNRGPSAAMLALLTIEPEMHPWHAFTLVREARPCAGLVYSPFVGARHVTKNPSDSYEESAPEFVERVRAYWTPERIAEAREARPQVWVDAWEDRVVQCV